MPDNDNEKTHVLVKDCIISEIGRCEAGHMISESDVHSSTWNWLIEQGFLRSVDEIQTEADSETVVLEPVVLEPVVLEPVVLETVSKPKGRKTVAE